MLAKHEQKKLNFKIGVFIVQKSFLFIIFIAKQKVK